MTEPADDAKPSAVDALQDDAAPAQMPEGAPEFRSYLRLPFRKRARFYRSFASLQDKQEQVSKLDRKQKTKKGLTKEEMADAAGQFYEVLGEMEDLLRIAAVDPEVFETWMENVEDEEFQRTFSAYVQWSQPGEASSSDS